MAITVGNSGVNFENCRGFDARIAAFRKYFYLWSCTSRKTNQTNKSSSCYYLKTAWFLLNLVLLGSNRVLTRIDDASRSTIVSQCLASQYLQRNWFFDMTTSQKHRNFISDPMGNKSVRELPGVAKILGDRLIYAGYDEAHVVFGQFLILKMNKSIFQTWMKTVCGANKRQSGECYQALADWSEAFL